MLSLCGGLGGVGCVGFAVIFMSNPTVVLRLGWGFDKIKKENVRFWPVKGMRGDTYLITFSHWN